MKLGSGFMAKYRIRITVWDWVNVRVQLWFELNVSENAGRLSNESSPWI